MREYLNTDSYLYLHELDDDILNYILELSPEELDSYIYALICRFYTTVEKDTERYEQLVQSYKSSLVLEKLYRANNVLSKNYTAIYTKTGLIREIVLDMYAIGMEKLAVH